MNQNSKLKVESGLKPEQPSVHTFHSRNFPGFSSFFFFWGGGSNITVSTVVCGGVNFS